MPAFRDQPHRNGQWDEAQQDRERISASNKEFDHRIDRWRVFDRRHSFPPTRRQLTVVRSEEHTSELQSLMRISYAVFCLKKKKNTINRTQNTQHNNRKQ